MRSTKPLKFAPLSLAVSMALSSMALSTSAVLSLGLSPGVVLAQVTDDPGQSFAPLDATPVNSSNPARAAESAPQVVDPSGRMVGEVLVTSDRAAAAADGQSRVNFKVRLLGRDGQAMKAKVLVTIEVDGARVWIPGRRSSEGGPDAADLDRLTPGVQVYAEDGETEFAIVAPSVPRDVVIRVTAGEQVATGQLAFNAELRNMIAVGIVEAKLALSREQLNAIQPVRQNDAFEAELRSFSRNFANDKGQFGARSAFFLKGKIRGDYLLTMALDTDKPTRERVFRDIDPNAFYPVYGDSSLRGIDAPSALRLYVRIDKNRSYLLFGNHNTGATVPVRLLGQYSRTLSGLRWHYETPKTMANVFVSKDTSKLVVDEFQGKGVSGPYSVSNPGSISFSERIEIVVRDRFQPALVLRRTPMSRFADYEFEPFSGRILFKAPVPSVDENGNPVSIRVSYEIDQGGDSFWLLGGDVQHKLTPNLEVGGSLVKDKNPFSPYTLSSANASVKLGEKSRVLVEVARTESLLNTNSLNASALASLTGASGEITGSAVRLVGEHEGDGWKVRGFYGHSGLGFNNPSAGLNAGRTEAGVQGTKQLTENTRLRADAQLSEDRITGGKRTRALLGVDHKFSDTLSLEVGLRKSRESLTPVSSGLATVSPISGWNAASGFGLGPQGATTLDPVTGLPIVLPGSTLALNAPNTSTTPVDVDTLSLRARLNWKPAPQWTLYGEAEQDLRDKDRHLYAVGGDYRFAERGRVYLRHEMSSNLSAIYALNPYQNSQNTVLGVDTSYMKDGQLFHEYRLRDAIGGRESQAAVGLRNLWTLSEGLKATTSFERIRSMSVPAGLVGRDATAVALGLDYTAHPLWKGATRLEWRGDANYNSWLSTISAARKLDRDWTMLVRNQYLQNEAKAAGAGGTVQNRFMVGVAYRDTDTNRMNTLARYEIRNEKDTTPANDSARRAQILSLHTEYHPSRPWWWSGRIAAKHVNERFVGGVSSDFSAYLVGGRVVYDLNERWSVGGHLHHLWNSTGRQSAIGAEVGYTVKTNMMITLGFNWRGFNDSDLINSNYTNRGVVFGIRWKFDEMSFEKARTSEDLGKKTD